MGDRYEVELAGDRKAVTGKHEMFSTFVDSHEASGHVNGRALQGRPFPRRVRRQEGHSTAFLAFSETLAQGSDRSGIEPLPSVQEALGRLRCGHGRGRAERRRHILREHPDRSAPFFANQSDRCSSLPSTPAINEVELVVDNYCSGPPSGCSLEGSQDTWNTLLIGTMNLYSATPVAVPEPGSYALLAVGLGCLGFARRRKAA